MTKWQTRQALYLLGLTGILYLFSCKSQDIAHCVIDDKKRLIFQNENFIIDGNVLKGSIRI